MNDEQKNPNIPVTLLPHAELPPAPDWRAEVEWLSEVSGGGDPIQVVPTG